MFTATRFLSRPNLLATSTRKFHSNTIVAAQYGRTDSAGMLKDRDPPTFVAKDKTSSSKISGEYSEQNENMELIRNQRSQPSNEDAEEMEGLGYNMSDRSKKINNAEDSRDS